eukprot:COSAG01_NODE_5323_length_4334_cov_107.237308_4_plen_67_part_00
MILNSAPDLSQSASIKKPLILIGRLSEAINMASCGVLAGTEDDRLRYCTFPIIYYSAAPSLTFLFQ